jgi:hypothetical protein
MLWPWNKRPIQEEKQLTITKCPFSEIEDTEELYEFMLWYFQNVKQHPRPGQITSFIERSNIKMYRNITPRKMSTYLNESNMYDADRDSQRYRYTLKEEYKA